MLNKARVLLIQYNNKQLTCITIFMLTASVVVFGQPHAIGNAGLHHSHLHEPSGLGASRIHQNILYSHNDENDDAEVFAINASTSRVIATFAIRHAGNNDWEDLSVGPCGQTDPRYCIYIHDGGRSNGVHESRTIYKVVEPSEIKSQTLTVMSKMYYSWTDGASNTVMVDPDGEVYIIAKGLGQHVKMVHLPNSAWGQSYPVNVDYSGYHFGVIPTQPGPDGADISPDGKEIAVINDGTIYYFTTDSGNYLKALSLPPKQTLYGLQDYGHDMAVCWSSDGQSLYIINEDTDYLYKIEKILPEKSTLTTPFFPSASVAVFGHPNKVGNAGLHLSHLDEPSGLGASRIHQNILYSHGDENDYAEVYAIDASSGRVKATFPIRHAVNKDWEDLSVGPCGQTDPRYCIYIHDGGNSNHGTPTIYKIEEPSEIKSQTLAIMSTMHYSWSDGASNTVMVDPNGEVYIIAKGLGHHHVKMVHMPYNAWGQSYPVNVDNSRYYFGVIPSSPGPEGADISPDGKEIAVINDGTIYYFTTDSGNYMEALSHPPKQTLTGLKHYGYDMAVCWSSDGRSLYIIDEDTNDLFKIDKI